MKLSIVVPVFNEVDSLAELHAQIGRVATESSLDLEVIFVDVVFVMGFISFNHILIQAAER